MGLALESAEFAYPPARSPAPTQKRLQVAVRRASGLAAADESGASDPYAVVYFDDEEVRRAGRGAFSRGGRGERWGDGEVGNQAQHQGGGLSSAN